MHFFRDTVDDDDGEDDEGLVGRGNGEQEGEELREGIISPCVSVIAPERSGIQPLPLP